MKIISQRINVVLAGCLSGVLALGGCDEDIADGQAHEVASEGRITPASLGLGDDWFALEPGLWTRSDAAGEQEFVGIGEAGKLHAIASLEEAEADLRRSFTGEASEETQSQLLELGGIITELRSSQEPAPESDVQLRCSSSVSAFADAYPIACGVGAKASASYSGCGYLGTVRTYAQAGCGYENKTHQCGPKTGNPVSCLSTTTSTGPAPCSSYAYAEITAPNANLYVWDQNTTRGACQPPPTTTIVPDPDCPPHAQNCQPK